MNKHAVSEGTKAVTKFNCFEGGRQSKSARAGYSTSVPRAAALHSPDHHTTPLPTHQRLQYPVGFFHRYLKEKTKLRVGKGTTGTA
jgi:hypothetical protein